MKELDFACTSYGLYDISVCLPLTPMAVGSKHGHEMTLEARKRSTQLNPQERMEHLLSLEEVEERLALDEKKLT